MSVGIPVKLPDGPQIFNGRPVFVLGHVAYKVEHCRHCFKNIALVPSKNGRLQPRDANGAIHFATCEVLQARRQRNKNKKPRQLKLV